MHSECYKHKHVHKTQLKISSVFPIICLLCFLIIAVTADH